MFKPVKKEIREEILTKVKEGKYSVPELARQYGISDLTIYSWLKKESPSHVSLVEYNKLKRQNEELKRIIGEVTLGLEREKKDRDYTKRRG